MARTLTVHLLELPICCERGCNLDQTIIVSKASTPTRRNLALGPAADCLFSESSRRMPAGIDWVLFTLQQCLVCNAGIAVRLLM